MYTSPKSPQLRQSAYSEVGSGQREEKQKHQRHDIVQRSGHPPCQRFGAKVYQDEADSHISENEREVKFFGYPGGEDDKT